MTLDDSLSLNPNRCHHPLITQLSPDCKNSLIILFNIKRPDIFSHSPQFTKWYVIVFFSSTLWSLHDGISDKTEWKVWRTKAKASFLIQTLKYKPYCVGEQVSTKAQRSLSLLPEIPSFVQKLWSLFSFKISKRNVIQYQRVSCDVDKNQKRGEIEF